MPDLAQFQDRFTAALKGEAGAVLAADAARAAAALSVHRNTIFLATADALRANFPTILRLVGDEWFRASARDFLERHPPDDPRLALLGAAYPDFLADLPAAADMPYLADVARIDRFWIEAHVAADADPLSIADLAALSPEAAERVVLDLHPSARLAWFDTPAPSIWARNRASAVSAEAPAWREEGVLVVRPYAAVEVSILDGAGYTFLDGCRRGAPLGEATAAAQEVAPARHLAPLIADLLAAGAFLRPEPRFRSHTP